MKKLFYFILPLFIFAILFGLPPTKTFAKDTEGIAVAHTEMSKLLPGAVITDLTKENTWVEKVGVESKKWNEQVAAVIPLEDKKGFTLRQHDEVQSAVVSTMTRQMDRKNLVTLSADNDLGKLKEGRHYTKSSVLGTSGPFGKMSELYAKDLIMNM